MRSGAVGGNAWRGSGGLEGGSVWVRGVGGGAWCIFRSSAEHVGSDSPGRGRSTPKVAELRHEPRAQHAVALARSAKPGPGAKPGTSLIRMRPPSHPRRDTSRPACPQCSPHRLKQPIFASSHQSGRRFEQQSDDSPPTQRPNMGGFATIGPRHAGDTPPEASYGSNSPRTCGLGRTSNTTASAETPSTLDTSRPTCPKRSPPQLQQPIFTSSHQSGRRFEHQPDDSPPTQRPNRGFCYHRPPTRRRHAARSLLW